MRNIYELDATILVKRDDEECCEMGAGDGSRQGEKAVSREIALSPLRK